MRIIDNLYVCTTPYQILVAMLLNQQVGGSADLYIVDKFKNSDHVANRLSDIKIFDKVVFICETDIFPPKEKKSKLLIWLGMVSDYIQIDKYANKILVKDTRYYNLYLSSKAYIGRIIDLFFLKNNILVERYMFDDGVGSYFNETILKPGKLDKLARWLFIGTKSLKVKYHKMLLSPYLYTLLNENLSILKIEKIGINAENLSMLKKYGNYIFDFSEKKGIGESIVILDQLNREIYDEEGVISLNKIYDLIVQTSNDVIFKPHPRETIFMKNRKYYLEREIPFEILCLNSDIEDKILVSVASTAIVTPKLLFDKEPVVILLYKIVPPQIDTVMMDKFFEGCRELYANQERFLIPKSISELKSFLSEWHVRNL